MEIMLHAFLNVVVYGSEGQFHSPEIFTPIRGKEFSFSLDRHLDGPFLTHLH